MKTWMTIAGFAAVLAISAEPTPAAAQNALPDRMTDSAFWKLVTDVSEPGGSFRSDNFVSNERQYQWVLNDLQKVTKPGGVYLGVGPEQNFTYIVAMRPAIAIIFDIRRQNMIQHLMYKALFEKTASRSDFMSRLFCRPLIARFDTTANIDSMTSAYRREAQDTALAHATLSMIRSTIASHGFTLTSEDQAALEYVQHAFCDAGVALNYSYGTAGQYGGGGRGFGMPSYEDLAVATDENGLQRGYLATEANWRYLKDLEARNLIVPVVGDFAGPTAIRKVGEYLRAHNATVSAFYASNVEQYLFQQANDWRRYYDNVATLPLDPNAQFIRSRGGSYRNAGGRQSVLASIQELVDLYKAGKISYYGDVMGLAH